MSSPILQMIRRLVEDRRTREASDAELLQRFKVCQEEAAFQALVRRHGPMVLGVCRCVLRNEADAEDAFQATFLTLARNAGAIRKTSSLGSWLHGVAHRTALKARAIGARRHKHEAHVPGRDTPVPGELTWWEAQGILHEELRELSEPYRKLLVLCYLQGKTQDEAAALLGMAKGTLKRRLEQGRALLRVRLERRGLGSAGVLMASAWPAALSAAVPAELAGSTAKTAVLLATGEQLAAGTIPAGVLTLVEGSLKGIAMGKTIAVLLLAALVTVLGLGLAGLTGQKLVQGDKLAGGDFGAGLVAVAQHEPAGAGKKNDGDVATPLAGPGGKAGMKKDMPQAVQYLAEQLKKNPAKRVPGDDQLGLYLLDAAGGDATLIVSAVDPERAYCGTPSWSSDGTRIFFDASPGFTKWNQTRLQLLEATGQGVKINDLGPGNCPTISPDGDRLAFLLNPGAIPGAKTGLYVMKTDGTDRRWLSGANKIPRWSPDGRYLLTVTFDNPCQLTLIDLADEKERPVQLPGHEFWMVPSWAAPDTLVSVIRSEKKDLTIALINVANPGAAKVKEILWRRGDGLEAEPMYPVYMPATKRGYFVGREPQGQALYSFVPGEVPRRLEPGGGLDGKIARLMLSPDGQYLLFCSDRP